jgi:hypothetical protein
VKPDLPILGRISAVLQLMLVKVAVVPEDRLFQVAPRHPRWHGWFRHRPPRNNY